MFDARVVLTLRGTRLSRRHWGHLNHICSIYHLSLHSLANCHLPVVIGIPVELPWWICDAIRSNSVHVCQVIVGAIFVLVGYINFNDQNRQKRLNLFNNIASIFVLIITVINVLIGGFGLNFDNSSVVSPWPQVTKAIITSTSKTKEGHCLLR